MTGFGRRLRALAVIGSLMGALALPAGASASAVTISGGTVTLEAGAGIANTMAVSTVGDAVTFSGMDEDQITTAPAECTGTLPANSVTCEVPAGLQGAIVNLQEGIGDTEPNTAAASGSGASVTLNGGPGTDTLTETHSDLVFLNGGSGTNTLGGAGAGIVFATGGSGTDTITGGDGGDQLVGEDGQDTIEGGAGGDTLLPGGGAGDVARGGEGSDTFMIEDGDGADTLNGGPGVDDLWGITLFALASGDPPFAIAADLSAGTASTVGSTEVDSLAEIEDVTTSAAADQVTGTPAANRITTDLSEVPFIGGQFGTALPDDLGDVVDPLGGADHVATGKGDDQVTAFDGFGDRIVCGAGTDTVEADRADDLVQCEAVTTKALDTTIIKGPKKKTRKKKAKFEFTSNLAGATFECSLDGKDFKACTSPHKVKAKKLGKHTLAVRAAAVSGLIDSSAAKRKWTLKPKRKT